MATDIMGALHFRDRRNRLVGPAEVETRGELEVAVISRTSEGQRIVLLSPDTARCRGCRSTECEHVERVEQTLADYGLSRAGAP